MTSHLLWVHFLILVEQNKTRLEYSSNTMWEVGAAELLWTRAKENHSQIACPPSLLSIKQQMAQCFLLLLSVNFAYRSQ